MCYKVETYITDARKFQKYGQYELAIDSLWKAKDLDHQHEFEIEIQKLLSFNYRKLENFELALYHINNAICLSAVDSTDELKKERAICFMNKGIIYEEQKRIDKVLECYLPALKIFTDLFNSDPNIYGLIINAIMTIGMFYYKQQDYSKVKEYLEKALPYFGPDKENDRRYVAIINTLEEIKEI